MTTYKKGLLPSLYLSNQKELRRLDEDLIRALNEQDANLSSLLVRGLNFTDNFDARFVTYTTNATPNTQDVVTHDLGKIPTGFIPVSIDKAAVIYKGASFSKTQLFLKCDTASTAVTLLIF